MPRRWTALALAAGLVAGGCSLFPSRASAPPAETAAEPESPPPEVPPALEPVPAPAERTRFPEPPLAPEPAPRRDVHLEQISPPAGGREMDRPWVALVNGTDWPVSVFGMNRIPFHEVRPRQGDLWVPAWDNSAREITFLAPGERLEFPLYGAPGDEIAEVRVEVNTGHLRRTTTVSSLITRE